MKTITSQDVHLLLAKSKDKQRIADLIIQYKYHITKEDLFWLLFYAPNKEKIFQFINTNSINEINQKEIYHLLFFSNDRQLIAEIFAKYKKNIDDKIIFILLDFSENKDKTANIIINNKNINLTDKDIYWLLDFSKNKSDISEKILNFVNIEKISKDIYNMLKKHSKEYVFIEGYIKQQINILFEIMGFNTDSSEQLAMNKALYKLPRKGMDDSINNYNMIQSQGNKYNIYDFEDDDNEDNIEDIDKIGESYGIYGSTTASQKNLDWTRNNFKMDGMFDSDAQEMFDKHNNNIERDLNEIPPGNARKGKISNNRIGKQNF